MANLIYNGTIIPIEKDGRVSVTNLYKAYKAAGRPKSLGPGNFKSSKTGAAKIKEYGAKGTWVWQSRTGKGTIAIVDLACVYLQYLEDPMAAVALKQVYETGESKEYNSPEISLEQGFPPSSNISSSFESQLPWGWIIFICLIIIGVGHTSQQRSPQQTPSQTSPYPSPSSPYYR
ncbi:hypothetical protein NG798_24495 [Ancylothrix sp. C2]|uniref:hypothetical protein n=1 Tax=Ancylothrix sp. D3o TaxID=2953691 RepID=UPI0021BA5A10|nr:hypothetical protein [Ancylothrix sp. D3o]MCT7952962.1 hypothetical protein [Ancylothrix sp. D3o]